MSESKKRRKKIILFVSIGLIIVSLAIIIPILVTRNSESKNKKIEPYKKIEPNENREDDDENKKLKILNSAIVEKSKVEGKEVTNFVEDDFRNLWVMGNKTKLQVLKVNENGDGYVESWTDNNKENGEKLLKNSNITQGDKGFIFKDSFGNLWSMGYGSTLQVLKKDPNKEGYVDAGWVNDNNKTTGDNLLKGSNINDGERGKIFQDSFGNLWSMGFGTKLQVLKKDPSKDGYVDAGWVNENNKTTGDNLLKGSNIEDGGTGIIFQDEFKNLWAMGYGTKLQVLKKDPSKDGYVNEGWVNENNKTTGDNLLKGSNIEDGESGIIFQDKFKNLWAMGVNSKLQVLKVNPQKNGYVNSGWIDDNDRTSGDKLLKNSNIDNSDPELLGAIFQDHLGNLWAMGDNSSLQVLKINESKNDYVSEGWTMNNHPISGEKLLKGNLLQDGSSGIIFQDHQKNLWAMSRRPSADIDSKLQVLKADPNSLTGYVDSGWSDDHVNEDLLKDSNIRSGYGGTIFEDSSKNLWTIGYGTKLQVYDKKQKKWISYVEKT